MGDDEKSASGSGFELGIAADHPLRVAHPLFVAPATGDEINTVGLDVIPVACMALTDILFEFDSSFVGPHAGQILKDLPPLREKHKNKKGELPPLCIFGHADPVGDDPYNKELSGRRARAIYGLLTQDVDIWEDLYSKKHSKGGDDWKSTDAVSLMKTTVGPAAPAQRKDLFKAYMAKICPFKLEKKDFLGKGADPEGKADYLGCGEFNPLRVLSKDENKKLSKKDRNAANQPNRRVVIYLFCPGDQVDAADWPCPPALKQEQKCHVRFFETPVKGDDRRKEGANRREHKDLKDTPQDTFACRFYDRIARTSPCEGGAVVPKWPPVVNIVELDKWFVPGETGADGKGEICNIKYTLKGSKDVANKVVFEVYASNYCNAALGNDGKITYSDLAKPVPLVYSEELADAKCVPNVKDPYEISNWSGKSTAADGMLKPRAQDKPRYIDVAFSPYTVHLRYFLKSTKTANDKEARIDLAAFWPRWDKSQNPAKLNADSVKIRWKILKCAKMKFGQIQIFDKANNIVFHKVIPDDKLTESNPDPAQPWHEFAWDGKLADGTEIAPAEMPYRVHVHMHTGPEEAEGVAMAAMHTEVRLFVHPETGQFKKDGPNKNKPYTDPNSLTFAVAPFAATAPNRNTDTTRWYQYRLAKMGFHPGPVDGNIGDMANRSILEFQRSIPRASGLLFARLNRTGNTNDAQTTTVLAVSAPQFIRPMFGDENWRLPASGPFPTDITANTDAEKKALNDRISNKDSKLVVWMDDRHYYTQHFQGLNSVDASYRNSVLLDNYRGPMSVGDGRVERDEQSSNRPSIPLEIDLMLMRKGTAIDATEVSLADLNEAQQKEMRAAMRKAIGPLRVDWMFDEIGEDLGVIDTGAGIYDNQRIRTRRWLEFVIDRLKSASAPNTGRQCTNAPERIRNVGGTNHYCCGIRPASIADYYKAPFGYYLSNGTFQLLQLEPHMPFDVTASSVICSHVYDDLGQAKVYSNFIGKGGTYLHPSRVAGDGYRFRSRISFFKSPAESKEFPNRKALEGRYEELPQAHTAEMRVWRKTSFRGYLMWAPGGTPSCWTGITEWVKRYYRAAFVHFTYESPQASAPNAVANLITEAEYQAIINRKVVGAPFAGKAVTLNPSYVWPFTTVRSMGTEHIAQLDLTGNRADTTFRNTVEGAWWNYCGELMYQLLQGLERRAGFMKGHFAVEFVGMPRVTIRILRCNANNRHRVAEILDNIPAGTDKLNKACDWCAGRYTVEQQRWQSNLLSPGSLGLSAGGVWLAPREDNDTLAHEFGHNRHLQHARGQPWAPGGAAPGGAQAAQHDAASNPNYTRATGPLFADPNKAQGHDQGWDRNCVMSYTNVFLGSHPPKERVYFCGKCILKNRGWTVEGPGLLASSVDGSIFDA